MACGCGHIPTSSSSTTTSNSRRLPKPPDSRVIREFALLGEGSIGPGFRRDSAGDSLEMPPDADQGVSSTTSGRFRLAELADSIEDQ